MKKSPKTIVLGFDAYNQALTGQISMTLTAIRTDPHHVPCVVIVEEAEDEHLDNAK